MSGFAVEMMEELPTAIPLSEEFAPELFESAESQATVAAETVTMALDAQQVMETQMTNTEIDPSLSIENETGPPESLPEGASRGAAELAPSLTNGAHDHQHSPEDDRRSAKYKPSTKHSSKNEGQHTDRRYLCYLCNKLFTRRRSVRDHISKIHTTKTWEPVRSLEVIVDPDSGEPIEPLEDIIARGPPAPLTKAERLHKAEAELDEEPDPVPVPTLKAEPSTESRVPSAEPVAPTPVIGRKRPAPGGTKKGTAKSRSAPTPNKRQKLAEAEFVTPFRSPSGTPVRPSSKLKLQTSAASPSPTPTSSRAVSVDVPESPYTTATGTPDSTNDDGEVFCICRKGDNHTWMIACDGGCDEWFHGNCVNIRERDGDLIDKYVCPNCRKEGFHTTWKRMCRRKGCRKPARVLQDPPSKYCSRDCGRMFFVEMVRRGDEAADVSKNGQYVVEGQKGKKQKKKRVGEANPKPIPDDPHFDRNRPHTPADSDEDKSEYETDSSLDDDMLPNRGGPLRAGEVKAIADKMKTVEQWAELGKKPDTPPREDNKEVEIDHDEFEKTKLASIEQQLQELRRRDDVSTARDTFLGLVKTRSATIADEIKKTNPKMKDLCGFDPRVTWTEVEFVSWWADGGQAMVESGKIGPPEEGKDAKTVNGYNSSDGEEGDPMPTKGGVCIKNRCQRHGSNKWQKAQLAELRFEQDLVRRAITKLELQERGIRERAVIRGWEMRQD